MELIQVKENIFYLHGAVNIGLLKGKEGVIVIDTGLDKSAANKIHKVIQSWNLTLLHIINTHSHADHFGGNHTLLQKYPHAEVWAPPLEEAIIRYSAFEGIYLFSGANPPKELQNKFLKAESSPVQHVVEEKFAIQEWDFEVTFTPGHAHQQASIGVNGVCFAGDGYFGEETLRKHKIPFLVDADQTIQSCESLLRTEYEAYIPGHGEMENQEQARKTIRANIDWHHANLEKLAAKIEGKAQGITTDEAVADLARQYEITINNMTSYVLYQTAVLGYLRSLQAREVIEVVFHDNSWRWKLRRANAGEDSCED
jgi:glyoxylase-like metal-dependent hydrolase (beta-lactamase superfamily II)